MTKNNPLKIYTLMSGYCYGYNNMAVDDTLLDWVRGRREPILIIRTYCWRQPTLSLGVHQIKSNQLKVNKKTDKLGVFKKRYPELKQWVTRPTGGRAIVHGEDISFAFITNQPQVLKQSLKESYQYLNGFVINALERLQVPVLLPESSKQALPRSGSNYVGNPWCFESHTLMDILDKDGRKIAGAAQCRRQNGLLQHGAAFIKPYNISEEALLRAIEAQVRQRHKGADFSNLELESFDTRLSGILAEKRASYLKALSGSFASKATNSGSHLAPASF